MQAIVIDEYRQELSQGSVDLFQLSGSVLPEGFDQPMPERATKIQSCSSTIPYIGSLDSRSPL